MILILFCNDNNIIDISSNILLKRNVAYSIDENIIIDNEMYY